MGRGRWRIEVDRALRARYFNLEIAMEPKRTGDGPKSLSPRVGGCGAGSNWVCEGVELWQAGQRSESHGWKRMTEDGVRAADTGQTQSPD